MTTDEVFAESLIDIFDTLGTDVTIGATVIKGNFRNDFISVNGVESLIPIVECLDDDVSGVDHGDSLTIRGTTYKVIGIQPGSYGTTTLILSKD